MCRAFVSKVVFGLLIAVLVFAPVAVLFADTVINAEFKPTDYNCGVYIGLGAAPDLRPTRTGTP